MSGPRFRAGSVVLVTAEGPLGVLDPESSRPAFHPTITLVRGDRATYIGPAPRVDAPDWHLIEVERDGALYLAPVHADMIGPAE